ncbi:MarR family winged helix-turn-helix transcriptional regulator [Streptomyces sp. NPDC053048]|uniref:MarR family winged helix-turn-helix transcriptional regulator n=1 Tax=Streptomyces sp. NPDC053048 TaxID=3365694 RepID=UPI0037CF5B58
MPKRARPLPQGPDDVAAVTRAVLTASRVLVAVSARSLAAVEDRVTLPQFRLLVVLSTHGPVKLVKLADLLGVNPSTAMRMVDRLHTAGLISRERDPGNRRETVTRLTPEGLRIVDEVTGRRREEVAAIVARMAPAQRDALVEALTVFAEAGEEPRVTETAQDVCPLGWDTPLVRPRA